MSEIKLNIDGQLNLNNIVGYDIAVLIQFSRFDEALDLLRYALYEYIEESFKEHERKQRFFEIFNSTGILIIDVIDELKKESGRVTIAIQNGFIKPSDLI